MGEIIELDVVYFNKHEVESVEEYGEVWGDVHVTKRITKYKPLYFREPGLLTYDSNLDDAVIKGLFKHDAAYDNQD